MHINVAIRIDHILPPGVDIGACGTSPYKVAPPTMDLLYH